nr:MAG TPA: hypothetical protein [Caudoviricetes sp.]
MITNSIQSHHHPNSQNPLSHLYKSTVSFPI